jgi:hypothetical protein
MAAAVDSGGSVHGPVIIPDLKRSLRHALPQVVEGKLVPLVLFLGLFELAGMAWALGASLGWSLASVLVRLLTSRPVSGIVMLSVLTLGARTTVAVITGSLFVYFLQPTFTTAVVGLAFLVSVPLGAPLAQRLAFDLLPFDDATKRHPLVRAFFVRMSLVWAATSLVNAVITVWLLLRSSATTFVMVKSALGPATAAATVGLMLVWLRVAVGRTGTQLVWAKSDVRH